MDSAARIMIIEYLFDFSPQTNSRPIPPNNTSDSEKNAFMALTATCNSVASGSMYEYQRQALGTKKCHTPKPREMMLPIVTMIFVGIASMITSHGKNLSGYAARSARMTAERCEPRPRSQPVDSV
jgi:hypothetical protein